MLVEFLSTFMSAKKIEKIKIEEKLLSVMRDVLEDPSIDLDSSVENVDGWDSVGHLTLVTAIEETWGVIFSFSEIVEMSSFKKTIDCLMSKVVT